MIILSFTLVLTSTLLFVDLLLLQLPNLSEVDLITLNSHLRYSLSVLLSSPSSVLEVDDIVFHLTSFPSHSLLISKNVEITGEIILFILFALD